MVRNLQKYLFYIYIFSINFEFWDPLGTGIDFITTKITVVLYLFSTLFTFSSSYTFKYFKKILVPLYLYFIFLTMLNIVNQSSSDDSVFNMPLFLNIILLHTSINLTLTDKKLLINSLYLFAISTLILTVLYILGVETEYTLKERITIFGNNQNDVGIRLCMSIVLLLILTKENCVKRKIRILIYIAIPLMLKFMLETGSRVSFISLVLCSVVLIFVYSKKINTTYRLIVIIVSILLIFVGYDLLLKDSYLAERLLLTVKEGDVAERDVRWIATLNIIKENFIIGLGETGFSQNIKSILGFYASPHNVILEIMAYTGVVGVVFFLIVFKQILTSAINSYKKYYEVASVVLLIPILGLILSGQILSNKIVWIIFAYIVSYSVTNRINSLLMKKFQSI